MTERELYDQIETREAVKQAILDHPKNFDARFWLAGSWEEAKRFECGTAMCLACFTAVVKKREVIKSPYYVGKRPLSEWASDALGLSPAAFTPVAWDANVLALYRSGDYAEFLDVLFDTFDIETGE